MYLNYSYIYQNPLLRRTGSRGKKENNRIFVKQKSFTSVPTNTIQTFSKECNKAFYRR